MKLAPLLVAILCASGGLHASRAGAATSALLPQPDAVRPVATTPADVAADVEFLLQAWRANVQELGAARLALRHSRDVKVRQFARVLVREHSAANLRFQRFAALRGLGIPKEVRASPPAPEFGLERLRGAAFDRQFVASVGVEAHRAAIALYQQEAKQGRDPAMVSFASARLPMLRKHLVRAEALQAQLERARRNAPAR